MRLLLSFALLAGSASALAAQDSVRAELAAGPLTLEQAMRLGREHGVNAALSRFEVRAARARTGETRADLLPTIAGQANVARQTRNLDEFGVAGLSGVTPAFSLWQFQVHAAQTVFDGSALARVRAARDAALASGLDAQAVGELSAAQAGLAYLGVLGARETVAAREADSAVAGSLLDQARQMVAAGVSPEIDATRSEVSFAAVRTQLEVARNRLDRARLDLLRSLDAAPDTPLTLADSLGAPTVDLPSDPAAAVTFAEEHRPELAAERARTRAAARGLSALRWENLPSVMAAGGYTQSGRGLSTLAGTWQVQLGVSVPLLDGFRRQYRAREQEARLDAQRVRERNVEHQVATEAREALLDLASARSQTALAVTRVRLAEEELGQAEQRFKAGVAGSVETTNAQGSLIAARDALIQARVNYGTARIAAYRALGVLDQMN